MREIALKVTLTVEDDVTIPETKDYVRAALESWCDEGRVKVVRYKARKNEE